MKAKKPILLVVMDGVGFSKTHLGDAVGEANTPTLDWMLANCPNTRLKAHGDAVGLPSDDDMGNSEVGHNAIGCGQIYSQGAKLVNESIESGKMYESDAWKELTANVKSKNSTMHFIGLLSDGGVHSHNGHLYGLLEMARRSGVSEVFVHCLMDGRDVPPTSGKGFVEELEAKMQEIGVGKIATVIGRYYAMDRDNRWERVEKAYAAMVYGEGVQNADPAAAVQASYDGDVTDEFIVPVVCGDGKIKANDAVVFFNFRPDRAREITRTFVDPDFTGFSRKNGFFPLTYVCMTQYDATMPNVQVAFRPQSLDNTFGQYISDKGLTQLRIAETEKYAHVTFFFNGGVEKEYPGEDRVLINSPKVATYDLQPEMSAYLVCDAVVERIRSGKYDVIVLNYANCDMVGHTGVFDAAKDAVEAVDKCVGRTVDAVLEMGGTALITADHGNADKMYEADGSPFTAHTTFPVPFCVVGTSCELREGGRLADIAPTMLKLLGLPQPAEMDGVSLIK